MGGAGLEECECRAGTAAVGAAVACGRLAVPLMQLMLCVGGAGREEFECKNCSCGGSITYDKLHLFLGQPMHCQGAAGRQE